MFSSLVQDQYGDQDTHSISICYQSLTQLQPLHYRFKSITTLKLNHCQLSSLTHIDQFQSLHHLSLKYNNLSNIKQIFKIKNKHILKSLDFRGNDIEHFQNARIQKLKNTFQNLNELNGVDYRFMELSRVPVRKEVETARILHRLDTLGVILESMNKTVVTENERERGRDGDSRVMTSQQKQKSRSISRDKENRDEEYPTQRRKQLQISTGQIDNLNHQPCQPTATFARQKQIEQKTVIGFKKEIGLSRIQRKSQHSMDISLMMKYTTNPHNNTSNHSGLFPDLNQKVNQNKQDLGQAFYAQNIIARTFFAWVQLSKYTTNYIQQDRPFKLEFPLLKK